MPHLFPDDLDSKRFVLDWSQPFYKVHFTLFLQHVSHEHHNGWINKIMPLLQSGNLLIKTTLIKPSCMTEETSGMNRSYVTKIRKSVLTFYQNHFNGNEDLVAIKSAIKSGMTIAVMARQGRFPAKAKISKDDPIMANQEVVSETDPNAGSTPEEDADIEYVPPNCVAAITFMWNEEIPRDGLLVPFLAVENECIYSLVLFECWRCRGFGIFLLAAMLRVFEAHNKFQAPVYLQCPNSGGSYQFFMDIGFFDKVKATPKLSAKNWENNAYSVIPVGLRSLLENKQGSASLLWVAGEERQMALMVLSTAEGSLRAPKAYIEIEDDGPGMFITQPSVPFSEDTATYSCFPFPTTYAAMIELAKGLEVMSAIGAPLTQLPLKSSRLVSMFDELSSDRFNPKKHIVGQVSTFMRKEYKYDSWLETDDIAMLHSWMLRSGKYNNDVYIVPHIFLQIAEELANQLINRNHNNEMFQEQLSKLLRHFKRRGDVMMKKFIIFVPIVDGHFYNVVVVNPQFADAENKKKDSTLPLTCFLVPDSQGIEGRGQSGWKDNVTEGM